MKPGKGEASWFVDLVDLEENMKQAYLLPSQR